MTRPKVRLISLFFIGNRYLADFYDLLNREMSIKYQHNRENEGVAPSVRH